MKTQNEMVLDHMRKHGTINLVTAYNEYGVMALHSRISNLRQAGHLIETISHTQKNRFGKNVQVFDYKLVKEAN
jgi:hypothetical protein